MLEACKSCKAAIKSRSVLYCLHCNGAFHTACLESPPEHDPLFFTSPPPWRCPACSLALFPTPKNPASTCRTCRTCAKTFAFPRRHGGYSHGVAWACSEQCAACRWCGAPFNRGFSRKGCGGCRRGERWRAALERAEREWAVGGAMIGAVWFWSMPREGGERVRVCYDFRADGSLWCADYKSVAFKLVGRVGVERFRARFKATFERTPFRWEPVLKMIAGADTVGADTVGTDTVGTDIAGTNIAGTDIVCDSVKENIPILDNVDPLCSIPTNSSPPLLDSEPPCAPIGAVADAVMAEVMEEPSVVMEEPTVVMEEPGKAGVLMGEPVEAREGEAREGEARKGEARGVCWKLRLHNDPNTLKLTRTRTQLRSSDHPNVYVSRSAVAGLGLFAARPLSPHLPIIQYLGDLITATLSDHRERLYHRSPHHRAACYLFALGDNLVVDATVKGNQARFINHSCEPNCDAKVVRGTEIWIVARRRVAKGEELFYDYKFSAGAGEDRVECRCGAKRCRGFI